MDDNDRSWSASKELSSIILMRSVNTLMIEIFFGRLNKALDVAPAMGWVIIDMKHDWNRIFNFE